MEEPRRLPSTTAPYLFPQQPPARPQGSVSPSAGSDVGAGETAPLSVSTCRTCVANSCTVEVGEDDATNPEALLFLIDDVESAWLQLDLVVGRQKLSLTSRSPAEVCFHEVGVDALTRCKSQKTRLGGQDGAEDVVPEVRNPN